MPVYTIRSTLVMLLIDFFFNGIVLYVFGSLLQLFPGLSTPYWVLAGMLYLLKTGIWLLLRVPLLLPIDRWNREGSPPDATDPALIRAVYIFPFDFTLFYGVLLGLFYAALTLWLVYGPGPFRFGTSLLLPGMMLAGALCAGAIAIGIPVNLILTARLSQRLAERKADSFDEIPGKRVSLHKKMGLIALALGSAPSLLLFSVQNLVSDTQLYAEARRLASTVAARVASAPSQQAPAWALTGSAYPFTTDARGVHMLRPDTPAEFAETAYYFARRNEPVLADRKLRLVAVQEGNVGALVQVAPLQLDWFALTLVLCLACFWPLLAAALLVRTIVEPIAVLGDTFHRIISRKRTDESDRVPIYFKDEVGRLAHNANRTIAILTEARTQLEETAESLVQKNQELEQAYRTKGEFLANMSHELRTPLNAIIGFSRLMKRKVGDTLPDRQRKNLELIEQSGEQLLALVNDLLDFERIEAGKLSIHREHFALREMLESLVGTMRPGAEEKGLELRLETGDLPATLYSDKDRLRQVLVNLLTNAIRYSDKGVVTLSCALEGEELRFRVRDEGLGMSADQLQKIFEPFHQVDASHTRERGGVGLGLAIVARLVKLLRGTITVQSELGVGSEFTLTLPAGDAMASLVPVGSGASVLVVDDNLDYLEATYAELTEAGFRVSVAQSGAKALEWLAENKPALVLLDIMMPEMDGWEVLRRLRSVPELHEVPVVITSVINEKPVGLDVEFAGWLTKPLQLDELRQLLVAQSGAGGGVVVVEDDAHTAQLMVQVFEDLGLQATVFDTESAARAYLAQGLPGVLVLDLHLQEGSGWSLLGFVRSLPGADGTRVFIYTASDLSYEERERLQVQLVSVIQKHGSDSLKQLVSSIVGDFPVKL